jgi:hypothetical protein
MTAIFDLDRVAYKAAATGQEAQILVSHEGLGLSKEVYKTRTELWGAKRTRDGGDIERINNDDSLPNVTWEEFEVEDNLIGAPIATSTLVADSMIKSDLAKAGTNRALYYLSEEESYRLDKSTLLKYKGNRDDMPKPPNLQAVKKYLKKKYKPKMVCGVEVDDAITEAAYKRNDRFVLAVDKDIYAQPTLVFNPDKAEEGIINCNCLGRLFWDTSNKNVKLRGIGRKFLYYQMLQGDAVDNYKAVCFSNGKMGEKRVYDLINPCKTDKECWEVMVKEFKRLYPKTTTVEGWRGNEIEINWLYVLNEMMQMARMRRFEGDELTAQDMLNKLEVKYD